MSKLKKLLSILSLVIIISIVLTVASFAAVGGGSTKQVSYTGQTVDAITFDGIKVEAKYSLGGGYGSSPYSCAALVMKFYKAVYGFDVWNLSSSYATPVCSNGKTFNKTNTPRVGDIVRFQDRTHWALVKAVKGNTVTIIEQNWGYYSRGGYVAAVNRTVQIGDGQVSFFTYSAYGNTLASQEKAAAHVAVNYDSWEGALRAANLNNCEQVSIENKDSLLMVAAGQQIENMLTTDIG